MDQARGDKFQANLIRLCGQRIIRNTNRQNSRQTDSPPEAGALLRIRPAHPIQHRGQPIQPARALATPRHQPGFRRTEGM